MKADPELAAALAGELRAADSPPASDPLPADVGCPADGRGAAYRLDRGGIVSVVLSAPTSAMPNPFDGQPGGTAVRAAITAKDQRLMLVSEPAGDGTGAPLENELQGMADRMAAKF